MIFPPDAAVPLSVRLERERDAGWVGGWESDRRGKSRQTEKRETGAKKSQEKKETDERRRRRGVGGVHTHALRHGKEAGRKGLR